MFAVRPMTAMWLSSLANGDRRKAGLYGVLFSHVEKEFPETWTTTRDQRGSSGLSGDQSNAVSSPLIGHLEKYLTHPRNWTEKKSQHCVHECKSGGKYFNSFFSQKKTKNIHTHSQKTKTGSRFVLIPKPSYNCILTDMLWKHTKRWGILGCQVMSEVQEWH